MKRTPALLALVSLSLLRCGPPEPSSRYTPSNLPVDVAFDTRSEVVLSGKTSIDLLPDPPVLQATSGEYSVKRFSQSAGGPDVFAFFMKDLTVLPDAVVTVQGDNPIIFVVAGRATIKGLIDVSADHQFGVAGGAETPWEADSDGTGGAPGLKPTGVEGAGGGGFCGRGGGATRGGGANVYSPRLRPLRGGSSGATAGTGAYGGAGGGAVQIFASESIEVTSTGSIRANGGGGVQYGGGGGSGGGILLEAPIITIASGQSLSAWGGGGGANYFAGPLTSNSGDNGGPMGPGAGGNPEPGTMEPRNSGGSATLEHGLEGVYVGPSPSTGFRDHGGGGAGGAGRIHFNLAADAGVVWPGRPDSPCITTGLLDIGPAT
ncbi:MAG: hypothetical protein AB1938_27460 [Myxococcota bacterium]